MTKVDYIHCNSCDHEGFDEDVGFSRSTASSEWWLCPNCGKETSNVDIGEE